MGLFSPAQMAQINAVAEKSREAASPPPKSQKITTINADLQRISAEVIKYFKDSKAVLIKSKQELNDYIARAIKYGEYAGIDVETTGLDRIHDTIVGWSLDYRDKDLKQIEPEVYIPCNHLVPIFDTPYKNQLSYEDCGEALSAFLGTHIKLVLANADFDFSMIHKDFKVDLTPQFFYDVILSWRCLKENELDNRLKILYNKYVLKGKGDPKTFSDLFPVSLFPYCKPDVAKLYGANDPKITLDLMRWQLPYTIKDNPKCKKNHLESISSLIWNLEMPLVSVCHRLHYTGIYLDRVVATVIRDRYRSKYQKELTKLQELVQECIEKSDYIPKFNETPPFTKGSQFNPDSNPMVKHLVIKILGKDLGKDGKTGKDQLALFDLPVTDQILKVRSLKTLIGTFTDKLLNITANDGRIHATFKQIGADTGRFSSADPNMQNIPSHAVDIRHMFRATPEGYITEDLIPEEEKDSITVSLFNYHYVKISDAWIKVSEVKVGDMVVGEIENVPESFEVLEIEPYKSHVAKIDITLSYEYLSGGSLTVKTPPYVMMSSDYSSQEPKLTAFVAKEEKMIQAFKEGRDIYATIASVSFGVPYENCLEFHPETHEYQPDGKARRTEAKSVLLGITYGRSIPSVADQLYGRDESLTEEEKIKKAQKVYDAVMLNFPGLRDLTNYSMKFAAKYGYVETILGRRRHIPDMQLPEFEFKPADGYINPDVDPMDVSTLESKDDIPQRIKDKLLKEFSGLKYFGQIIKKSKELLEKEKIKVINHRSAIREASRMTVNSRIQGSAADQTKMSMLLVENNEEWERIGGRLLVPVHDELIGEVPMDNWEAGGKLLSKLMCDAANFLPFPSKCDVETTLRWYGLEFPCPYKKPDSIPEAAKDNFEDISEFTDEDISWMQYCLTECEYQLPVLLNSDGSKPNGIASKGINGVPTDEMQSALKDYISKYQITAEEFFDHIEYLVFNGVVPTKGV